MNKERTRNSLWDVAVDWMAWFMKCQSGSLQPYIPVTRICFQQNYKSDYRTLPPPWQNIMTISWTQEHGLGQCLCSIWAQMKADPRRKVQWEEPSKTVCWSWGSVSSWASGCVCVNVYVYMCVYLYYCCNVSAWPALKWIVSILTWLMRPWCKLFKKKCFGNDGIIEKLEIEKIKNIWWPSFSESFPSSFWTFRKISFGMVSIIKYPGANKTYIEGSISRERIHRAYGSETSSVLNQEVWASFMPPPCPMAERRPGSENRSVKAAQGHVPQMCRSVLRCIDNIAFSPTSKTLWLEGLNYLA